MELNLAMLFIIAAMAIMIAIKNKRIKYLKQYYRRRVDSLELENTILHQEFEIAKKTVIELQNQNK